VSATTTIPEQTVPAPGTDARPDRTLSRWLWVGALGAATAGGLHIAVAAGHLESGELAVGFFLLTALAQLGLAAWLMLNSWTGTWPDRKLVTLALAGTVALTGLYVVAHTTSLLDAFAITDSGHSGGAHAETSHTPGIDPITGVDYSQGVATRGPGPVALAGEAVSVQHSPGILGPATVAAEVLVIGALAALQPATWRRRTLNALLALGALAWGLWFTGVLA